MKNFEKHHKKIYTLVLVFIYAIIPCVLFILLTSRTSILFGMRSFAVLTGSMVPKIPIGAMVFTLPQQEYQKGDIITFNRGQITVTHRIIDIQNGLYQTKGDANKIADNLFVRKTDIIGKDIFILPFLGKFTGFIKTIPGFFLFIVLPTFILIAYEIRNIKKEWEKEVEKKLMKKMHQVEQGIEKAIEKI